MYRVVKYQIGMILGFEVIAICVAASIALIIKGFSYLEVGLKVNFVSVGIEMFFIFSVIVILLNVWGFISGVKDIRRLAKKFGASASDVSEAIYEYGFREAMAVSFINPEKDFRIWLEEKRRGTTTVVEVL